MPYGIGNAISDIYSGYQQEEDRERKQELEDIREQRAREMYEYEKSLRPMTEEAAEIKLEELRLQEKTRQRMESWSGALREYNTTGNLDPLKKAYNSEAAWEKKIADVQPFGDGGYKVRLNDGTVEEHKTQADFLDAVYSAMDPEAYLAAQMELRNRLRLSAAEGKVEATEKKFGFTFEKWAKYKQDWYKEADSLSESFWTRLQDRLSTFVDEKDKSGRNIMSSVSQQIGSQLLEAGYNVPPAIVLREVELAMQDSYYSEGMAKKHAEEIYREQKKSGFVPAEGKEKWIEKQAKMMQEASRKQIYVDAMANLNSIIDPSMMFYGAKTQYGMTMQPPRPAQEQETEVIDFAELPEDEQADLRSHLTAQYQLWAQRTSPQEAIDRIESQYGVKGFKPEEATEPPRQEGTNQAPMPGEQAPEQMPDQAPDQAPDQIPESGAAKDKKAPTGAPKRSETTQQELMSYSPEQLENHPLIKGNSIVIGIAKAKSTRVQRQGRGRGAQTSKDFDASEYKMRLIEAIEEIAKFYESRSQWGIKRYR